MKKTIKINKAILALIIISVVLIGYYIYYKNRNIYEEFEINSITEELLDNEQKVEKTDNESNNGSKDKTNINKSKSEEELEKIIVHITGEINNPGVVELKKGARIIDAVNEAGGFTEQADKEKINLAYILSDGMKIYIANKNEKSEEQKEYITISCGDNVTMEENKMKENNNVLININEATQADLETLPGIGPSLALKIISHREQNGRFLSIQDIKNVSGIGENKFENIKELICV